jgi:hypothetical protein
MKIGIVSSSEHCKAHVPALQRDGHQVRCLGAAPDIIPTATDVVVLRCSSCSHRGDAVARAWARDTGKPLVVENGLTGIRRELATLLKPPKGTILTVIPTSPTMSMIREKLCEWALSLRETRPTDPMTDLAIQLRSTLKREYPHSAAGSLVPGVLTELFLYSTSPSTENQMTYPTSRGPFPDSKTSDGVPYEPWTKVYSEEKLRVAYDDATSLMAGSTAMNDAFMGMYLQCEKDPSLDMRSGLKAKPACKPLFKDKESIFKGKPIFYCMYVSLLFQAADRTPKKRPFYTTYHSLTGRGSDTRLPKAVAWFLGLETPPMAPAVEKAIGARRATNKESVKAAPEPTFAALEREVRGQGDAILEVLTEMEELRSAVQNGRSSAPSTDPFAALDEIKGRLRAMGFKGTLTLTIE